jgi:hypothetical protein
MTDPIKTCQIDSATFEATVTDNPEEGGEPIALETGVWHLRVSVTIGEYSYSSTHPIEGAADMDTDALTAAVLALY